MAPDLPTLERISLPLLDRHLPGWQALWLFGSCARGDALPGSDVDLAVLCPDVIGKPALETCRRALEANLHRDVDLIDLRAQPATFQNEILSGAVRLGAPSPLAADQFETLTLSLWQKLNEERRGILADVLESGRVFANG